MGLWDLISAKVPRTTLHKISVDQVEQEFDPTPFRNNGDYFQIRINEMYLAKGREWFTNYIPVVSVVSEFSYEGVNQQVPVLLGPRMLQQVQAVGPGVVLRNERVAGLHPYRGGPVTITVALSKLATGSVARNWLGVVETLGSTVDLATGLGSYLKISKAMIEGFECLTGQAENTATMAVRNTWDQDANDDFSPGYWLMTDNKELDPAQLSVRDGTVYNLAGPKAVRLDTCDYVLFSIMKREQRGDLDKLPFSMMVKRAKDLAANPDEDSWKGAKAQLVMIHQAIVNSPDLTPAQAKEFLGKLREEILEIRDQARHLDELGRARSSNGEAALLKEAVSFLDL